DLVGRARLAARRDHRPVAGLLGPAPRVDVVRVPDLAAEQAAQAGLLLDLAAGCLRIELARLELALGKRPVVVRRPVDEQDLEPAGCPTHDESARGANELAHAGDR